MRNLIFFTLIFFTLLTSYCRNNSSINNADGTQQTDTTLVPVLLFDEYEHNFGKVSEGEKISFLFTFRNGGDGMLVISNAITSCGCTVPKYDTKPVSPGGSGKMEVVFDTSGRNGIQTKTISVRSNASVPVVLLKITAEVVSDN